MLGDAILTEAAGHYNFFKKKKGESTATQGIYMENMYAIRMVPAGIYTATQAKNTPNIILNALVDTLNVKAKVPHTLVVMLNDYRFWNDTDLLASQMDRILNRFLKEIRRIVEARNESLPARAVNWDYPRIFITRPLPMPNDMARPYPKGFKANRRKYNKILLRCAELLNYTLINFTEFTKENDNGFFTQNGDITPKGYRNVWTTISDSIHRADNNDRIIMNKLRAKQLASQISLTKDELKPQNYTGDDISDDELMDADNAQIDLTKKAKSTKRALLSDFNDCAPANKPLQYHSPGSDISEYYTATGHQNFGFRRQPCPFNRRKRKQHNKSNWRNVQH